VLAILVGMFQLALHPRTKQQLMDNFATRILSIIWVSSIFSVPARMPFIIPAHS
jgi:hypothetical protein